VAGGGQFLSTKYAPLFERRVRTGQVEPRFGALRLAAGPAIGGVDGRRRRSLQTFIEPTIVLVELNIPPDDDFREGEAAFHRRRWAGARKLGACLIESRAQDRVVDRR